ncbi:hypothetical protein NQZ68_030769 [Dissostichus eleginoides]|nr:hypothetical protein NQZ68_030769 [Dissostichus eleginoides]
MNLSVICKTEHFDQIVPEGRTQGGEKSKRKYKKKNFSDDAIPKKFVHCCHFVSEAPTDGHFAAAMFTAAIERLHKVASSSLRLEMQSDKSD